MGPRSFNRGNGNPACARAVSTSLRMGPRSFNRGNGNMHLYADPADHGLMGPRSFNRGNGNGIPRKPLPAMSLHIAFRTVAVQKPCCLSSKPGCRRKALQNTNFRLRAVMGVLAPLDRSKASRARNGTTLRPQRGRSRSLSFDQSLAARARLPTVRIVAPRRNGHDPHLSSFIPHPWPLPRFTQSPPRAAAVPRAARPKTRCTHRPGARRPKIDQHHAVFVPLQDLP